MNNHITDASDFNDSEIPNLSQLDSLLRCHICKDFLKIPVLTPCGHTFCSLCIRGYLNKEPKCPLCLNELRESMLRSEFLVSELVKCYNSIRPDLLDKLRVIEATDNDDVSLIEVASDKESNAVIVDLENEENLANDTNSVPVLENDIEITATYNIRNKKRNFSEFTDCNSQKKINSSSKSDVFSSPNTAECPICHEFYPIKILERTHLDECLTNQTLGISSPKKLKTESPQRQKPLRSLKLRSSTIPSRNITSSITKSSKSRFFGSVGKNSKSISYKDLPSSKTRNFTSTLAKTENNEISHVENYLKSSKSRNEDYQRLPKVNFTSMTISQIKQKLLSLNLPINGSRQLLINRYNHYEMIWNSNFHDSLSPVEESELRRQLTSWELNHNIEPTNKSNVGSNSISSMLKQRSHNSIENSYQALLQNFRKDTFDRNGWSSLFNKQFNSLIIEARKTIREANSKPGSIGVNSKLQAQENNIDSTMNNDKDELQGKSFESLQDNVEENPHNNINKVTKTNVEEISKVEVSMSNEIKLPLEMDNDESLLTELNGDNVTTKKLQLNNDTENVLGEEEEELNDSNIDDSKEIEHYTSNEDFIVYSNQTSPRGSQEDYDISKTKNNSQLLEAELASQKSNNSSSIIFTQNGV
ncbi:hypothetical protein TBLA_0I02360 [Henningerozyma blattae CBS 6284]|uniref:Postreplication repair E3 ubiquitin-protein ligase RAD18 n=1 Tax=Henningerozyma blattae (strain ATCC 34711 / CBS 6284 / DSM 70876 / NBRC 10599 / NRRL Y-10934 / UCD 77-7) TaxID=1071380 RepID=I2H942_HENB6|nr:hypothetical protein TBLA_0I02360 [Tetrapisispora blattae CBS 6284]CCH62894.1 hypothetical protein TBLA_0I02360 [Tetrapisispora blattae CBS 6284]